MEQAEVFDVLKTIKTDLQKEYSLQKIGIFGSFAKGTHSSTSDIDIVVEMAHPSMFELIGIKQSIEERLQRKVDIVRLRKQMNPFLKKCIEEEAIYV